MSVGFGCRCLERSKPVGERRWVVLQRECNHSAFSGYRRTPSAWSAVRCLNCGAWGRTKAAYVSELRDATEAEGRG